MQKFKSPVRFDSTVNVSTQTANTVPVIDASKNLTSSSVTSTELGYLSGVTSAIQTQFSGKVDNSEVGAANGVASLDSGGKVPVAQLPSTVMIYKGAWDASTNTPTLADGTGTNGWVYRASVAGTQNLGSGAQTWAIGDFAIYNGAIWQHSPAADGVSSVNGATGAVTVNAINQLTADVTAGPASGSASAAATVAKIQGTTVSGTTGSGNVAFSASPTFTGTLSAAAISASGAITGSNLSGTNTGDQTITLTGDVTGSGTGSFAATIGSNKVTNAQLAQAPANTIKGNNTGSTANELDLTTSQVKTMLGITTSGSPGDISETLFSAANNQSSPANVTGLAFANGVVRSFSAIVSIALIATASQYEEYELDGIQRGSDWVMSQVSTGDDSGIVFSITTAGQVQYTSLNSSGFVSDSIRFRALTTSV